MRVFITVLTTVSSFLIARAALIGLGYYFHEGKTQ